MRPRTSKPELFREALTPIEAELLRKLACARFPVASWPKRFVRDVRGQSAITDKQRYWIARLALMYRRQLHFAPEEFLWCIENGKWTQQELDRVKFTPRIQMPLFGEAA